MRKGRINKEEYIKRRKKYREWCKRKEKKI